MSRKRKPQGHPAKVAPRPALPRITADSPDKLLHGFIAEWVDHELKRMEILQKLAADYPDVRNIDVVSTSASVAVLAMIEALDALEGRESITEKWKKGEL